MQSVNSWKYYNHAVIPNMAPHEEPVLQSVYDNSIWKQFAKEKPLFAMWTEGFDCGFETNWWYVIKDTPIDINEFTAKRRKNIRTALKKCKIYKIDPSQHAEELYETYRKALTRFKKNDSITPKKAFIEGLKHTKSSVDYWCGEDVATGKIIGWMSCIVHQDYVETSPAKYDPEYLKLRVSDAIHYTIIEYYINQQHKRYISSGNRSLNHETNAQIYKIENFGFRKAYCKLNMLFRPEIRWIVRVAYSLRYVLEKMDNITFCHQMNAVIKMIDCCDSVNI